MYTELTINNKSLLKRFSHGKRFKIAVELLNPSPKDVILDYGTGDGFMLNCIRSASPSCEIIGYEPTGYLYKELTENLAKQSDHEKISVVKKLDFPLGKVNKICCLEVLEHLTQANQKAELRQMINLLIGDGVLVISVPVEIGFSSFLKNMARLIIRQAHPNTNIGTIIKSLLGVKINRGDEPYISTHIGFYYPDLEKLILSEGLRIQRRIFSPIKPFGSVINSQVFYVINTSVLCYKKKPIT